MIRPLELQQYEWEHEIMNRPRPTEGLEVSQVRGVVVKVKKTNSRECRSDPNGEHTARDLIMTVPSLRGRAAFSRRVASPPGTGLCVLARARRLSIPIVYRCPSETDTLIPLLSCAPVAAPHVMVRFPPFEQGGVSPKVFLLRLIVSCSFSKLTDSTFQLSHHQP